MHDPVSSAEQQGRWSEVVQLCDQRLHEHPRNVALWQRKAVALRRLDDLDGACAAYRQAIALAPEAHELHYGLGLLQLARDDRTGAAKSLRAALRRRGDFVPAHNSLGRVLAQQGDTQGALACWRQALTIDPRSTVAHANLGKALGEARQWREAEQHLRQAVRLDPSHARAWNNLGNALRGQYRLEEAERCYRQALRLQPDHHEARRNLALQLKDLNALDEALELAQLGVAETPDVADYNALGQVQMARQAWKEALETFRQARVLDGQTGDIETYDHCGLAKCLIETGQEAAALRLIEDGPPKAVDPDAWETTVAMVLELSGRPVAAREASARAAALAPNKPEILYSESLHLLRAGDYRKGFAQYDYRKQCPGLGRQPYVKYGPLAPDWDGTPAPDQRLLVYAEQGLGDSLQFCRFLPLIRGMVRELNVAIQPPIQGLLARQGIATALASIDAPPPDCDLVCSLASLPDRLGITLSDLPGAIPYLHVDPRQLAHWRQRLEGETRPRVGVVWGGNPNHANDHRRSLSLSRLRPLFEQDRIAWYSLQVGPRAAEITRAGLQERLTDLSPELTDFEATAAAIACLDLVISADTAVAHLAGALNHPAWILLPDPSDWRWLIGRADSPWYPSLRLFRQHRPGDWDGALADLTLAIEAHFDLSAADSRSATPRAKAQPPVTPMPIHAHPDHPEPRLYTPSPEEDLAGPSAGLGAWLQAQGISLALTTYQSSRLYLIGSNEAGKVSMFKRLFEHAMGLAADSQQLWLASRHQIWRLENILAEGERHDDYDRLFVPRVAHTTGDLDLHDLARAADGTLCGIATRLNALVTLDERFGARLLWRPPFIEPLTDGDRCHLNGLAMRAGRPTYVTLVAPCNEPGGWRDQRADGGELWDLATNQAVIKGLSMPHSPRWYRDRLWLLNSGRGEFGYVDFAQERFVPLQILPGYARGLAFHGDNALIGLSLPRDKSFQGLPLDDVLSQHGMRPQCGLVVVHLEPLSVAHHLRFEGAVREIYDIQVIPGARRPKALGFQTDEIKSLVTVLDDGAPRRFGLLETQEEPAQAHAPKVTTTTRQVTSDPELSQRQRETLEQPSAAAYLRLGQAFRQRQAWLGAIDAFRCAIELDPDLAIARHHLGMSYLALDEKKAAEEAFTQALERHPQLARTRSNLAQLLLSRGDAAGALTHFTQAMSDEPSFLPARLGQIEGLIRLGRHPEAAAALSVIRSELTTLPPEQVQVVGEQLERIERRISG